MKSEDEMAKQIKTLVSTDLLKPRIRVVALGDGRSVMIRELTAKYIADQRGVSSDNTNALDLVAASLCDESGNQLYTTEQVGQMGIATVEKIIRAVMDFNGFGKDAIRQARADLKNASTEGSISS